MAALTLAQLTDPGTLDQARQLFLNSLAGLGFVTKTGGTGSGALTVSGSPSGSFQVQVNIVSAGELGTAMFTYSLDGGVTINGPFTVPGSGIYTLGSTGTSLNFFTGAQPPSFNNGDAWVFNLAFPTFPVTSWNSGGVARTLVEADAQATWDLLNAIETITEGGFLFTASGSWLDLVAQNMYGLTRNPAVSTQGLVNLTAASGAGPYTIAPGTMYLATASGLRYININSFVIPLSGTVSGVLFQAEKPGSVYNVGNNNITVLVTGLAGVTANNPDPGPPSHSWITQSGQDTESDSALQARCAARWVALGPGNPALYYDSQAKKANTAVTRTNVFPDGSTAGQVDVVLAGAAGGVSGGVVSQVQTALQAVAPQLITVLCSSATGVTVTVTATLYVYAASLASVTANAANALAALIAGIAVGGTVYLNDIIAILSAPSLPGVRNVVVTSPGSDTVLTANQVATLSSSLTFVSV